MRPAPDARTSAILLVAIGLAASAFAHFADLGEHRSSVASIVFAGAAFVAAGVAKLIHGTRIRLGAPSSLMRRYAVAAALVGVAHLALMGFFRAADPFDGVSVTLMVALLCFGPALRRGGIPPEGETRQH